MKCEICQRGMEDLANLYRQNEKGIKGVWRCDRHFRKIGDEVYTARDNPDLDLSAGLTGIIVDITKAEFTNQKIYHVSIEDWSGERIYQLFHDEIIDHLQIVNK